MRRAARWSREREEAASEEETILAKITPLVEACRAEVRQYIDNERFNYRRTRSNYWRSWGNLMIAKNRGASISGYEKRCNQNEAETGLALTFKGKN